MNGFTFRNNNPQQQRRNPMAEVLQTEVVETTSTAVLDVQERATIDLQIATAKKYPRDLTTFTKKAVQYATLNKETAESCIYHRPVGRDKDGKMKYAEGLSVRTAEIVFSTYGNIRAGARIVSQTERQVIAQGVCHDIENNVYVTTEVVESTVDRYGRPYDERMRITIAKAAMAKARRDAIFQVVPKALAQPIEKEVRAILFGTTKALETRREAAMSYIKKLPIADAENRVFAALDIKGIEDMGAKELELLTGLRNAIKENETTLDDAFPPVKKSGFDNAAAIEAPKEQEKAPTKDKEKKQKVKLPADNPPPTNPPPAATEPDKPETFKEAVTMAAAQTVASKLAESEAAPASAPATDNNELF